MKFEWHKAPDFAEVAEALGVTTKAIAAVRLGRTLLVLYSPDVESDPYRIQKVELTRDQDGILRPLP